MERITFNEIPTGMVEKMMGIETYLASTTLDRKLLELVRLHVSHINHCPYCIDMHYKELKHCGESDLRISMLPVWRETDFFTEKERLVLEFGEILAKGGESVVSDSLYETLTAHFSIEELAHLTFAIMQINSWNRLVKTFQFEPGLYQVTDNTAITA